LRAPTAGASPRLKLTAGHKLILKWELILGPLLACILIKVLWFELKVLLGSYVSSIAAVLLLLALMAISFLVVRHRLLHSKSSDHFSTNERHPIMPYYNHEDEE
jgi:hypothetical protein